MRTITYWLSLIAIFAIPWENMVKIPGLGTLSRILGLLVALCWITNVAITGKFRRPHIFHLAVLMFVLWNGLSIFWTVDYGLTSQRTITYCQLFIFVYILWDLYTTPHALQAALQAYVLGAYVTIGSILQNYSAGSSSEVPRFSASGFDSNTAAIILALGIPLAWSLILSKKTKYQSNWLKWSNLVYVPLALLSILLTGSRSALMGAFPSVLFIFSSLKRFRPSVRILSIIAIIIMMFAFQPFATTSINRILGSETGVTEQDLNGRGSLWSKGFDLIAKHPILGVGSGAFRAASLEKSMTSHSFIIGISAELGIIGFGLFLIILAVCFYYALQQPKWNSRLWLAVLCGWVLSAAVTQNFEARKQTWLFFSLAVQWAAPLYKVTSKSQDSSHL